MNTRVGSTVIDIAKAGYVEPRTIEDAETRLIELEADIEEIVNQLQYGNESGVSPNGISKTDTPNEFFKWKRKAKSALNIKKTHAKWLHKDIKSFNRAINNTNAEAGSRWRKKFEGQLERANRLQGDIDDLRETLENIKDLLSRPTGVSHEDHMRYLPDRIESIINETLVMVR